MLLPVDTAGRVLELLLCLEHHWKKHQDSYPLVLLQNVGFSVLEFAKSMIEYMDGDISNKFNIDRVNPFDFNKVRICQSLAELHAVPSPKIVLATPCGLDYGFSNQLFSEWVANPLNMVIVTSRNAPGKMWRGSMSGWALWPFLHFSNLSLAFTHLFQ